MFGGRIAHASKRDRAPASPAGWKLPSLPRQRAQCPPGRARAGVWAARHRRVRNSRCRPHGAGLSAVSRSPSRRPRLPPTEMVVITAKEGDARALPTRLPVPGREGRVRSHARPPRWARFDRGSSALASCLTGQGVKLSVCAHFEGFRRGLIRGRGTLGWGWGRPKDHRTRRAAAADGQTAKALSLLPERERASENKKQDGG